MLPRFFWMSLLSMLLAPGAFAAESSGDDPILSAATSMLAERYPTEVHRLEVRLVRSGGEVTAGPLRLEFPATGTLPKAHTQVDVLTETQSGWQKSGWALLYVAHFDSVVVAGARLGLNAEVQPEQLYVAWMETTRFRGAPLRPADFRVLAETGPLFATRTVRDGTALRTTDLRPPYAADTGDTVLMQYQRAGMTLELTCKAREKGMNGDEIRLFSPDTGQTYRARLTGPGTAAWTETL